MSEDMVSWERPREVDEHLSRCARAMNATAFRLDVDPVALAEACQDGTFLETAIECAARWIEEYDRDLREKPWEDKLAALRRTEPKP